MGALSDTAAITLYGPRGWKRHEQERLAAAASQPLARIARLCWPDPAFYLRDIEGFHQMLRPACHRRTARYGITEPVPCQLPSHQVVCRRHRLWTGASARSHASQLDLGQLPEVFRAQRRHIALLHNHRRRYVDDAITDAAQAICQAVRAGAWTPRQSAAPAPAQPWLLAAGPGRSGPCLATRRPWKRRHRDRRLPRDHRARRANLRAGDTAP